MRVITIHKHIFDESDIEKLSSYGIDITFCQENELLLKIESDEIAYLIGGIELNKLSFCELPHIRVIQLITSGYEYIDVKSLKDANIKLTNATDIYSIPISEWVVSQILIYYKNAYYFYNNHKQSVWLSDYRLNELHSKSILVFGTGSIGKEIVRRLDAFGCVVDGVNTTGKIVESFRRCYSLSESVEVIGDYEILIFCLPSTEKTKYFLNIETLRQISRESLVINVGRGDLINEEDLMKFLDEENTIHFILDVAQNEPLPSDHPFWSSKNLFISPHNSFASINNKKRLRQLVIENVLRFISKKKLVNEVDLDDE